MRTSSFAAVAASALAFAGSGMYAQSVISAHSGVLHHYEGDVTIDGKIPQPKSGTFADVKEKQELQTQVGRAEMLLTPGVFLRLGENSSVRMVSAKLSDTQLAFLSGSAIIDFVDVIKDNSVKISYQDYEVSFLKKGIYRFDGQPAEFRVYGGEAVISHGGNTVHVKDGRAVPFTPALVSEKFDNKTGDELYRWAKRRSEYIAVANLSAAKQMSTGSNTSGISGWYFNPYYSMFTFVPGTGIMCDPFAVYACYYSPWSAWRYYNNYPYYNNYNYGGGGGGFSSTSNHNSYGYYPTSIGTSSTLSTYSGNSGYSGYSSGPSVSSGGYSSGASGVSSGGGASAGGGGFSGGGGGGGGGGHAGGGGGGSAGGHGR
ncbi:MAG TPA: hypothetical protein VGL72_23885 [Bryobacteraceae bacterium]|jgi:hypothetical protein